MNKGEPKSSRDSKIVPAVYGQEETTLRNRTGV